MDVLCEHQFSMAELGDRCRKSTDKETLMPYGRFELMVNSIMHTIASK